MKYKDLLPFLEKQSDKKFAEFSKSLSNSEYISIGVKNPVLRAFIKEHKNDPEMILDDFEIGRYLEIDFIYFGLALLRAKTIEEQFDFLLHRMRFGKSWVLTDCSQTYMKKCSFETFRRFFNMMIKSKYVFDRRFAYVFAIKFAKLPEICTVFPSILENDDYMVMMGEAWFLATVAIYYPDEVYSLLRNLKDINLKRKTISKINESFRIDQSNKNRFKELRK